jgi:uncharacterized protein (DUF1697 family)
MSAVSMKNKVTQHTYISLLRGINISGQKIIKIDELKKLYESCGFRNVKSYIQSGNIIFEFPSDSPEKLVKIIEKTIKDTFSFDVTVIMRTPDEFEKITQINPFAKTKPVERLYVTFLSDTINERKTDLLNNYKSGDEDFRLIGKELYLYYPNGYGKTKLTNNIIEAKLGVKATTRNWNTVNKLFEMSKEL